MSSSEDTIWVWSLQNLNLLPMSFLVKNMIVDFWLWKGIVLRHYLNNFMFLFNEVGVIPAIKNLMRRLSKSIDLYRIWTPIQKMSTIPTIGSIITIVNNSFIWCCNEKYGNCVFFSMLWFSLFYQDFHSSLSATIF